MASINRRLDVTGCVGPSTSEPRRGLTGMDSSFQPCQLRNLPPCCLKADISGVVAGDFGYEQFHVGTTAEDLCQHQHFIDILLPNPPDDGAGIFLHDDMTVGYKEGCVALPNAELDAVLGWLNPPTTRTS